jgi:hypothetical protein
LGRSRELGTAGARVITRGRAPQGIGTPVGKNPKTRAIPQPPVKRKYTRCESKNKKGQPCKAPNVKGQPYCQGHLNALAARERNESARAS